MRGAPALGQAVPDPPASALLADVGERDCFHPPGPLPEVSPTPGPRDPSLSKPTSKPELLRAFPVFACLPSLGGREYRGDEEGKREAFWYFHPKYSPVPGSC